MKIRIDTPVSIRSDLRVDDVPRLTLEEVKLCRHLYVTRLVICYEVHSIKIRTAAETNGRQSRERKRP